MNEFSLINTGLDGYTSNSQKARLMTEPWVANHVLCPACGNSLNSFPNNKKVADFYCSNCQEEFELKSGKNLPTTRIVDGAYSAMMERLNASNNPSLMFLHYHPTQLVVRSLLLIPRFFFIPDCIEPRKPLSINAKRAGWQGCNIRLDQIPVSGRIWLLQEQKPESQNTIQYQWKIGAQHFDGIALSKRAWRLALQQVLEQLPTHFTLAHVYAFEAELSQRFPDNRHIHAKIRQQLQYLRDCGEISFLGKGHYRKNGPCYPSRHINGP